MDGCVRGSKARSNYRLLCLECLEDRFLLSPLAALPPDPAAATVAQQAAPAGAPSASSPDTTTRTSPAPLVSDAADRQAAAVIPKTPPPALHPALATVAVTPPVTSLPEVIAAAYPSPHDDDSHAAEYAEHEDNLAATLQGVTLASCAGTLSQGLDPNADGTYHCDPIVLPQVGVGIVLATLPASWEAALGLGSDHVAHAALLAQPAAAAAAKAAPKAPILLPAFLGPLAGVAPFDLVKLEKGVDAFFTHLTELANEWAVPQLATRAVPWFVAVTAVALEVARRRRKAAAENLHPDATGLIGWPGPFSGDET
jgi:hypothetical protein